MPAATKSHKSSKKVVPKSPQPVPAAAEEKKPKRNAQLFKRDEDMKLGIFRVLKQVHPDVGISKLAMTTLNSVVLQVYKNISSEAAQLASKTGKSLLSAQDIQSAVKICVPGELAKQAVSAGARALAKYDASREQ